MQAASAQDFNQRYLDQFDERKNDIYQNDTQRYYDRSYNPPIVRPSTVKRIGNKTFIYSGSSATTCMHFSRTTYCR